MLTLDKSLNRNLLGIRDIISDLKYDIQIRTIAIDSNLGKYLPNQLYQYDENDYNYKNDVYSFLVEAYEKEDVSFEIFFEKYYNSIKKVHCCRRTRTCKEINHCGRRKCERFLDNGIKATFTKYIGGMGFSIDNEGYVVSDSSDKVDIKKLITEIREKKTVDIIGELLPSDIIAKGEEMSETYVLLYCIENSIRIFVEKICTAHYGDNFLDNAISTELKRKIDIRKSDEIKNRWLSFRGENDLFYLDLEDLRKIITKNWDIFNSYFPDQNWIKVKIEEIGKCRNLIAHNSYINKNERTLVKLYYEQILVHIQAQFKN